METICGSGAACELKCPVMSVGRVCPTADEFFDELERVDSQSPWGVRFLAATTNSSKSRPSKSSAGNKTFMVMGSVPPTI